MVFVASRFFFDGDQRGEIKEAYREIREDLRDRGVRQKIFITPIAGDRAEQVEGASRSHEQLMAWGTQVRRSRAKAALSMFSEKGVQFLQRSQQSLDILRRAGMYQVEVEGIHGGTVQGRADAADNDEVYLMADKGLQYGLRIKDGGWHRVTS